MLYRDFKSQRKLSLEYDPLHNIGGMAALESVLAERDRLSKEARKELTVIADVPYGPTLKERLDFYPAKRSDAPIVVIIHGGYWVDTRVTRDKFGWVAKSFVSKGYNVAIIDYAVGPKVTIDEIVRQCRAAVAWTHKTARDHKADPTQIYLVGNSVGAHLLAMSAVTPWLEDYGLPTDLIKGGTAISGIYDLEPIPFTWIQPMLQLEWGAVRRNSPISLVPHGAPPLLVSYGTAETNEFQRQSLAFATAWESKGNKVEVFAQTDADHFTVMNGFGDPESELMRKVLDHMKAAGLPAC